MADEVRRVSQHRWLLGLVVCAQAVGCAPGAVVPVFGPAMARAFGVGPERLGLVFSALNAGAVFSVALSSLLGDRVGHRLVLRVGLAGSGLALVLCGLAPGPLSLTLGLAAVGLFCPTLFPAATAISLYLFPAQQRRVFTANLVVCALAGVVWPAGGQFLLLLAARLAPESPLAGIRAAFLGLGGAALLLQAVAGRQCGADFRAPPRADTAPGPVPGWRGLLAFVLLLAALHGSADACLYNWLPTFLDGLAKAAASPPPAWLAPGFALSLYSAAYLVGRLALSCLPERTGRRALLVVPGLLGGTLAIAGLASRRYELLIALYALSSLLVSLEYPNIVALGGDCLRGHWGALVGLTSLVGSLTAAGSVAAVGWLSKSLGLGLALELGAAQFLAVGLLGAAWVLARGRQSRCSTPC